MHGLLGRPNQTLCMHQYCKLKICFLKANDRSSSILLVPLGSPRGGHLVDKHDARIIFLLTLLIVFLVILHMTLLMMLLVTRILAFTVAKPVAVTVLETIIVLILVLILVTFFIDCQRHMCLYKTR